MMIPGRVTRWLLVVLALAASGCERAEAPATGERAPEPAALPTEPAAQPPEAAPGAEAPLKIATPRDYGHPELAQLGTLPEGVGLSAGTPVPDFEAIDALGQTRTRDALVAEGPLLVVFYRGGW